MSKYIGATVVNLSVDTVDVTGDITATDSTPEVIIVNDTHEDTDGSREGKLTFKGQQSGGEETTLAQIQASHDGTADDEKGDLIFKTNDGSDGASPTEAMRINSDQNISIPDNGKVMFGTGDDLQIYHNATNSIISNATGDLSFDLAGDLVVNADGGNFVFQDDNVNVGELANSSSDFVIASLTQDKDILFKGNDGGSTIEAMRIDMSEGGYVGIGLTAPTAPLTVKSPSNAEAMHIVGRSDDIGQIKFYEADHTTILATIEARNSFVNLGSVADIPLTFMTNNNERMRLSGAHMMVGNTDVSNAGTATISVGKIGQVTGGLQMWATTTGTSFVQFGDHASTHFKGYVAYNHSNDHLEFATNSTARFRIASNGDLTATDTSISSISDERLKENIADYSYDITKFKQFTPKTFDWKNPDAHNGRTDNRGFIAQDVKEIDEYLVGETEISERSSDRDVISDNMSLTSRLGELDAMYISVIQQLITKIETLETKVAALEGE